MGTRSGLCAQGCVLRAVRQLRGPEGVFVRALMLPFKQTRGRGGAVAGMSRSPGAGGVETPYFNTPLPGRRQSWVYLVGFNCAEANKGIKHQRCHAGSECIQGRAAEHRAAEPPWGPGAAGALTQTPQPFPCVLRVLDYSTNCRC